MTSTFVLFAFALHATLFIGASSTPVRLSCYETCDDDGVDTTALGRCIQRPVEEGGHGSAAAQTMKSIYDTAVEEGLQAGQGGMGMVLKGLTAIQPGADVPNPEGLAMCMAADDDKAAADAFYWAPNCNMAPPFCRNLTVEEEALGNIGYVVDAIIHGDNAGFHRYAFNDTYAIKTSYQSPTLSAGFKCSDMEWFKHGLCLDPLAMSCPTVSSRGTRNANQYYGTVESVVVGMQLREDSLAPCLNDGASSSAAPTSIPSDTSTSSGPPLSDMYWAPTFLFVSHFVCTALGLCII